MPSRTAVVSSSPLLGVRPWVMALRPKTLSAAVVPVIVATALVKHEGFPVLWWVTLCALFSSVCIQIGTNLVNDAIDFKKGADSETRIGPRRVTQSGLLNSKQVMFGAGICFALAFLLGVPLVLQGGWPIVMIGLVSLALGYAYTGGPFPLAYLGLGDLFVILFFGLVAVEGTFYLHTQKFSVSAVIAGLQVGCLATVLIAINNFRDSPEDAKVGKRTLAVRFGAKFARAEILTLTAVPFLLGTYWARVGPFNAALLPIIGVPIARRIVSGVFRNGPSPVYNNFLAMAGALQLIFGMALALALAFSAR